MNSELPFTPALEQARLVRERQVTPSELVELYLSRIDAIDPGLGSYITVAHRSALAAARAAEARLRQPDPPPFCGVPISVKDLHDVEGLPTTMGVGGFRNRIAVADESVVARLRAAGFVILGKTNVPELGITCTTESRAYGPCRNPWDRTRTVGGSSGGAAAALAAGLCPIAHGSDGGGSLRTPAAACGVFAIKPARGRVSPAPAPSSLMSTSGPLARTVADAAALLDVMSGNEPGDAFWPPAPELPFLVEAGREPGRLRIAVTDADAEGAPVDPACRDAVRRMATLLERLGHEVEEAAPEGWASRRLVDVVMVLISAGQAAIASTLPPLEELDPVTRCYIRRGWTTSGAEVMAADAETLTWGRRWVPFFEDHDVLLTPQKLGWIVEDPEPERVLERSWRFAPFTAQWNFTGQPAVTVPAGADPLGMPVAVQLVGRPAAESTLLRLAAQLEREHPGRALRPPSLEPVA